MKELSRHPQRPARTNFLQKQSITALDQSEIVQALEWGWATTGARSVSWSGNFRTATSQFYTHLNDVVDEADLNQLNTVISPNRKEIGALAQATSGSSAFIIEIKVFGRDIDLKADFYQRTDRSRIAPDPPVASGVVSCGSTYEWSSAFVLLEVSDYDNPDHLVRFTAKKTGETYGYVKAIALNEIRHVNLAYERLADLVAYGSEWIGPYADYDQIDAWDSDGAASTLSATSGSPTMMRDALSARVHAVNFDPSSTADALETAQNFDLSASDGFLFACAVKLDVQDTTRLIFMKLGGSQGYAFVLYCDGSAIAGEIQDGGYRNVSTPLGAGQWVDCAVRWRKSDALLELWVNGSRVDTSIGTPGTPLDDSAGVVRMGSFHNGMYPFDGQAAMPLLLEGSYTSGQVQHLLQWRRSIHGLF